MNNALALSILALTVGLSIIRPPLGSVRVQPPWAAVLGATLMVSLQIVSPSEVEDALLLLSFPIITIISLMTITLVAEQAGVFRLLGRWVAVAANGSGLKLFGYLFFTGTVTGAIFTNDAAVLIFTPMVFNLIEEIQDEQWTRASKIPYYFAVLYVANLAGPLVISNPINIVVASIFGIGFLDYALWMFLPAMASILTTFACLRFAFRRQIPERYHVSTNGSVTIPHPAFLKVSSVVLFLTLVGLFTGQLIDASIWSVAAAAAIMLLILYRVMVNASIAPIVCGIGWDVIIFVTAIFIVAVGLQNAGLTDLIGRIIVDSIHPNMPLATTVTAFTAAVCSAVINNHPTAGIMALAIEELNLSDRNSKMLAFSALIGGDVGPKMLPIGSLAALLWFRMLRARGVDISYALYIKLGVPITIVAILMSILMLNFEIFVLARW